MSGFSIACTTCRARLKVRDLSAVGQILACPKCGSMVLVEAPSADSSAPAAPAPSPPAVPRTGPAAAVPPVSSAREPQDTVPPASVSASVAATRPPGSTVAPVTPFDEDWLAPAPETAAPPVPMPTAVPTPAASPVPAVASPVPTVAVAVPSAVTPVAASDSPAAPPAPGGAEAAPPAAPGQAPLPPLAPPPAPDTSWVARHPGMVWIGGGIASGLLLAVGAFLMIAWLGGRPASTEIAQGDTPVLTSGSPSATGGPASAEGTSGSPTDPGESEGTPATTPAPKPGESSAAPAAVPGGPASGTPDSPVPPAPQPAAGAPAEQPVGPLEPPSADSPKVEQPAKSPPLAPAAPGRAEPEGPPDLQPVKPREAVVGPQPVGGRFAGLFGDSPEPSATTPPAEAEEPASTLPGEGGSAGPAEPEIVRPRMREIDLPARLADPLGKLKIKDMPLTDLLQLMSDLSTIPFSLDTDALRSRWIPVTAPVSVDLEQTTVRGALVQALEPWKLGLLVSDGQVRITHAGAAEMRRRTHDVSDLAARDPQQLEMLSQWIQDWIEPESWQEAGGQGKLQIERFSLVVDHRDAVHFQLLYLCDKLRAARQLPPRGKYSPGLLAPASLPGRARAALETPIRLNFNRSTRLTQILARLGQVAGVTIVVDWQAVHEAGWNPAAMAKLSVDGVPLAETLTRLLGPRDLTFRTLDDQTVEVTTPAAVERHLEWEAYPLADLVANGQDPQPLLEQLQDAIGANHFRALGGLGSLRFDPVSRCLLVALPEPQQRRVFSWLAQRRPEAGSPEAHAAEPPPAQSTPTQPPAVDGATAEKSAAEPRSARKP
ncbi:MAG: hypothetical protein U0935_10790 [Pirellulales bacterium]